MDYKLKIANTLNIEGLTKEEVYNLLTPSANIEMGDFSLPCFTLARSLRKAPKLIAEEIVETYKKTEWTPKVEAVNGYVNFYLNRSLVSNGVLEHVLLNGEDFAKEDLGKGKNIVMDYASVNIAKQIHIGHLYTTAIGNSLNKMYKYMGYKTVGINYLGDYGVQFGDIIAAHKTWGSEEELDERGIDYIQEMYAKSKTVKKEDEDFEALGKEWFGKIEAGDTEAVRLYETFKKLTLEATKPIFDMLGVHFDEWNKGESYYTDKMEPMVEKIKEAGLLIESRGKLGVDLEEDKLNFSVIKDEHGITKYITRDLAAAPDRFETYNFEKSLYITANEQILHFAQLFKILEKMGYPWAKGLVHVVYGRVRLPEGKLSSRHGAQALLKDILNYALNKATEIIENKNPNLTNKEEVAKAVGVGAVMYTALSNSKIKDSVFDLDEALSFEGETAPYMQYTYVRCSSVLKKHKSMFTHNSVDPDYQSITSDAGFEIVKIINNFNSTIKEALNKYEPSILSKTLISLAKNFNKFYHEHKIITSDAEVTSARIALVKAVRITMKLGLNLLGIDTVEEM